MTAWLRIFIPVISGLGIYFLPVPNGVTELGWSYLSVFVGVIVALILEPFPPAFCSLVGVLLVVVLKIAPNKSGVELTSQEFIDWGLSGFQNSTVWLIFTAYVFSLGYQKTGLGQRLALHLISKFGKSSLGLGYAVAFADLILAPFIPSNTARSGGIIYPIVTSIPPMYNSSADHEPRKIGAYLCWNSLAITCVTSSMFLTGLAPNLLALSLVEETVHLKISWADWFIGFAPVGIVLFLLTPFLSYIFYPPTQKKSLTMPIWAKEQLKLLGAWSRREKIMGCLAILTLVLWIFGGPWISSATVGLLVLCLMVFTGVVSWQEVMMHNQAWSVLVWFATLVVLAGGLADVGVLSWLANGLIQTVVGYSATVVLVAMVTMFFLLHYFFASGTAHITALLPVFLLGVASAAPEVSILKFSMLLCFSLGLMGVITPFATGTSPIWYGSGYIETKKYWVLGAVMGAIYLLVLLLIGLPWLSFIGVN